MDPEEEDAENTSIRVLFYLYTLSIFVCCQFIEPIDLARKVNPHIRIVLRVAAGQKTKLRARDSPISNERYWSKIGHFSRYQPLFEILAIFGRIRGILENFTKY